MTTADRPGPAGPGPSGREPFAALSDLDQVQHLNLDHDVRSSDAVVLLTRGDRTHAHSRAHHAGANHQHRTAGPVVAGPAAAAVVDRLADALLVMVLDPDHHRWLLEHDPKALEQAAAALKAAGRLDREAWIAAALKAQQPTGDWSEQ